MHTTTEAIADPIVSKAARRWIPVAKPNIDPSDIQAVGDALRSGQVSGGPVVAEFERAFARAHGHEFGVACNSGTTALQLALAAIEVEKGMMGVVMPTLTMVAVGNAARYLGAKPVFVDSDNDGNIMCSAIAEAMKPTESCVPGALVVPHIYGMPARIDEDWEFKQVLGIDIIEDCAECHYATYPGGQSVGSIGTLATFSFYANKIIGGCGEGGMVITSEERLADRLRSLRAHAFSPTRHFCHQGLAYGYRMTEMQGAIGLSQHKRRWGILERRSQIATKYRKLLANRFLSEPGRRAGGVWWVYPLVISPDSPFTRDQLRAHLAINGVETRTFFVPLHRQVHLAQFAKPEQRFPVADRLAETGLYLPLYPDMSDADVGYICELINNYQEQQ